MRKALVVGINYYQKVGGLFGCVDDAHAVKAVLDRNSDGTVNFGTKLLTGTGPADMVTRAALRESIKELFCGESDIALFYFAGHGHVESTGGYLIASDAAAGDEGLPLNCGFNRWMQHTQHCVSRRSVANEIPSTDLLLGKPESLDVGALAEG